MAPLACLLQQLGHRVRGADGPLYPPMSTLLEEAGIEPLVGYDPEHLSESPDLVIVGNAVPRQNPEAEAVERLGLPKLSMPEAVARFFLEDRQPLVVAGTHGKTTTTSIAAWTWTRSGADPGYLVGGIPKNLDRSFHIGTGSRFIIEGDEYNCAYFDRGPKFLHYRPQTLILTSVEYDHADLYPDPAALIEAYRRLVRSLPEHGLLVACGDSEQVRTVAADSPCRVIFYGLAEANDVHPLGEVDYSAAGSRFTVADTESGEVALALPLPGEHNVSNALAVWTAARHHGLEAAAVRHALAEFSGASRRLEELGTSRGITVVDDFAHHPTAVEKSLDGLRKAHPDRRLVALFEPRSLTAGRSFFSRGYRKAFAHADVVLLAPVFHRQRIEPAQRLDVDALMRDLAQDGVSVSSLDSIDEVLAEALRQAREGDVIVTMSSGSFDALPHRLLAAFEETPEP
ncbi:MAG: UDP-N-acetylmuramate:L-alanyl-gamma-D-glutamyl-meso-diaminopimelate ligase [bacterium]|nr:UDP-N-acetylmuramate:L-alanyl-gamma-D-glutamyl-meso-diaminopimelate ligase [bacterium]